MERRIYTTGAGTFRGLETEACVQIRGIRYASSKRFEAPVPWVYGEGIQECFSPAPMAVQIPGKLERMLMNEEQEGNVEEESCQYLSITLPAGKAEGLLPVMVWFHGGAYKNGGCDKANYNRELLAAEQNVIVVGVNYRLGILGFVKDREGQPANLGLLDAIEALRWIHDNIRSFGGDPDCVTIFGQSSGADLVRCLILSVGTENLYRRAILQSDPIGTMKNRENMERRILAEVNTLSPDASIAEVKAMMASVVLHVREKGNAKYLIYAPHYGVDPLLPEQDHEARLQEVAKDHEFLIGCNAREVTVYGGEIKALHVLDSTFAVQGLIEHLVQKLSNEIFVNGSREFAERCRAAGARTYFYRFFWKERESFIGAGHSMELPLLFGGDAIEGKPSAMGMSAEEIRLAGMPMRAVWAEFARTGRIREQEIKDILTIEEL